MRRIPGIVVIAAAAALWAAGPASAQVVISEFRTRGPAGGNDEYVELRNTSSSPVDISGWRLQGCASGTPGNASDRTTVPADVTLAVGQAYLFANNAAGGYSGATEPDRTYGTGFTDFAATNNFAGIRIVNLGGTVIDGVGSPNSPCREGTGITTPGTNGDNSFERIGGTQDTNNNAADFQGPKPGNPQNFEQTGPADPAPSVADSDPGNGDANVNRDTNIRVTFSEPVTVSDGAFSLTCGTTAIALTATRESDTVYVLDPQQQLPAGAACTLRVEGDAYSDTDTDDPPDTGSDFSATFTTTGIEGLRIHDIQGRQHLSPYRNSLVAGVPGVVTATRFNGFFVQDPRPDKDSRTSEGIFVFTGSPVPAAAVVGAP